MWVLKKGGLYVSGNTNITKSSYTSKLEHAKRYATREQAANDSCPENEHPVKLDDCFYN